MCKRVLQPAWDLDPLASVNHLSFSRISFALYPMWLCKFSHSVAHSQIIRYVANTISDWLLKSLRRGELTKLHGHTLHIWRYLVSWHARWPLPPADLVQNLVDHWLTSPIYDWKVTPFLKRDYLNVTEEPDKSPRTIGPQTLKGRWSLELK